MNRTLLPAVFALGCSSPPMEGTSVGNPTEMTVRVAPSDDIMLAQADLSLQSITLYGEGSDETIAVDETLNTLDGATIEMPDGEWGAMVLTVSEPMVLSGSTRSGDPANLRLDVSTVTLRPVNETIRFDRGKFVLELASPAWLDAENAGYDPDAEVLVDPDTPAIHDDLVAAIESSTSLFGDDGDRDVSDDERQDREAQGDRGR